MADPGTAAVLVAALADSASVAAFVARLVAAGRSRWAASRDERVIRAALVEAIATAAVDHVRLGQGAGELSDGRWVTGKLAPLLEVWTGHSSDLGTVLYVAAATQWSRDVDRWTHAAVDAIGDGLKDRTVVDDVFDVHAIIEDLPRALTSALIQLALPGRPLDDHWSTFYEAHKRLDALMDDEVWRLPRPSVHQRAGYLATHLTQVNAQVKAVPPTWGPDAPFNFDAVDQPAAVRLYKPHGTEQLVIDDARPAAYDPKGALGHRVDAASALTDPTHRLMLVVGEPGYGKSWLLRSTAARYAAAAREVLGPSDDVVLDAAALDGAVIPIWMRLDELAAVLSENPSAGFATALVTTLTTFPPFAPNRDIGGG